MDTSTPSASELMIIAASRALRGNRTVFVGVGLPNIACNLARRSHSPDMELVYESACEIAINARRIFMIMRLSKRAFVGKIDFQTSPGHLDGGDARQRLGMPGYGPDQVITDKALFTFDNPEREMMLVELAPGQTVESVQASVGWPLRVADSLREMTPPTAEELTIVREQLDPQGLYR